MELKRSILYKSFTSRYARLLILESPSRLKVTLDAPANDRLDLERIAEVPKGRLDADK